MSAVLSGVTVIGTFSTVVFSSETARQSVDSAFETLFKALEASPLYDGIKKTGETLNNWGTMVISTKDDFKSWIYRYLGPDGLKSGTVILYNKLEGWVAIVYNWFATKFIEFVKNIPDIVKNWNKLRLSLFKWGTFLGGGGGSALWAMFGSGNNWDKLGDLLGSPEFADVVDKFSTLLEDNSSAFSAMSQEEAQDIFEKILEDPAEAKETIEELLEQQKEKNQDQSKDQEETEEKKEKKKELTKEEIMEEFNSGGGGSPKNPEGVFKNMVGDALQDLVDKSNSWDQSSEFVAWNAMNNYIHTIRKEVNKKVKKPDVKQKFLDAIKGQEQEFINSLAKVATKAFNNLRSKQGSTPLPKIEFTDLVKEFGEVLEKEFTVEANNGEEGVSIKDQLPEKPRRKKK